MVSLNSHEPRLSTKRPTFPTVGQSDGGNSMAEVC